mmetsp:Transcript_1249/g.8216  ORF Transcript_1249/g.8216 Transcript_1249/m.8216 type:complete len:228 (+) Transcript_1249:877-1560(+)
MQRRDGHADVVRSQTTCQHPSFSTASFGHFELVPSERFAAACSYAVDQQPFDGATSARHPIVSGGDGILRLLDGCFGAIVFVHDLAGQWRHDVSCFVRRDGVDHLDLRRNVRQSTSGLFAVQLGVFDACFFARGDDVLRGSIHEHAHRDRTASLGGVGHFLGLLFHVSLGSTPTDHADVICTGFGRHPRVFGCRDPANLHPRTTQRLARAMGGRCGRAAASRIATWT